MGARSIPSAPAGNGLNHDMDDLPSTRCGETPSDWDARLLDAATRLGSEPHLDEMLAIVGQALSILPDLLWAGLGAYDPRRGVVVVYPVAARTNSTVVASDGGEFSVADAGITEFVAPDAAALPARILDLKSYELGTGILGKIRGAGGDACQQVPLYSRSSLIGLLYVGYKSSLTPNPSVTGFVFRLARILTPAFWSQRTHDRLSKGDRRRASLVELSHAINNSLQFDNVINAARRALVSLEGHLLSIIGLLQGDGSSFQAYKQSTRPGEKEPRLPEPEVLQVAHTSLSWIMQSQRTYESGDLSSRIAFPADAAFRDLGVRRYVAAPMFVRGRIIGAFFFGSIDPHPALTTDVWLYENMALQLALAIDNASQYEQLRQLTDRLAGQNVYLREEIQSQHNFGEMVGRSPPMRALFEAIARVAPTSSTVLILGETGVGKELVARAIHSRSDRAEQPLVKINCAAIPDGLVESELFGHERGAFTSAQSRRIGRFELAQDGTLFLDEVGELPLSVQSKLLRVLQDGEFERVGGAQTIRTNARIMAATNRDLAHSVHDGRFRSDLYYRLNVFPILVPSLASRRDDIPLLAMNFVQQFNRRMGKQVTAVEPGSMEMLMQRAWPGNVRELQHVIERSMILCDKSTLHVELPPERSFAASPAMVLSATPPIPPIQQAPGYAAFADAPRPTSGSANVASDAASPAQQPSAEPAPSGSLPEAVINAPPRDVSTLDDAQRSHILQALDHAKWQIEGPTGAAATLGLNPSTLRFRMKKLGIHRNRNTMP